MVVRGPLTDSERVFRDAIPPMTDSKRSTIRKRAIATANQWATAMLRLLKLEDQGRFHQVEREGAYRRKYRGARSRPRAGGLASPSEIINDILAFVSELHRVGAEPTLRLLVLARYASRRTTGPALQRIPLDERSDFQAAIRHAAAHPHDSDRKIAKAAGVDHKTIARWRRLPIWRQEIHDAAALEDIIAAFGE